MGDHIWAVVILVDITSPVRNVGLSRIRTYVNVEHLAILSLTSVIVMYLLVGVEEVVEEQEQRDRPVLRE
jgi:hypothetical protein